MIREDQSSLKEQSVARVLGNITKLSDPLIVRRILESLPEDQVQEVASAIEAASYSCSTCGTVSVDENIWVASMMSEWYTRTGYTYFRDNTGKICVGARCICEANSKIIAIVKKRFPGWKGYHWQESPWKVTLDR